MTTVLAAVFVFQSFSSGFSFSKTLGQVLAGNAFTVSAAQQNIQDPLGGYNVLIADRGNNRVIEMTPGKKIIWDYHFHLPVQSLGADDAFFADGGSTIMATMEYDQIIEQIDYATKKVTWRYGSPGVPGSWPGYLRTPDDAYKLSNGDVTVADISNCRVLEISPSKKIVRQYGVTRKCGLGPGQLDAPNGDTPLPGGGMLISNIKAHNVIELNSNWQKIATYNLPITYPSDPQLTHSGNILVSDYTNPGKILEISKTGAIVWQFTFTSGNRRLNKPSIAIELPNGNILATDDDNNRVIVIDKKTDQIVWQYGITGQPGSGPNQLNDPDGIDIILPTATSSAPLSPTPAAPLYSVGQAEQSAVGSGLIQIHGYRLKAENGYIIASDEPSGPVGPRDLPIFGSSLSSLEPGRQYLFIGTLTRAASPAINGNRLRFTLSAAPQPYSP